MQPIVRAFGAVLASSALVLGASQVAVAAGELMVGAIDWKPCQELPAVDCGFVTLPVDHGKPGGEKFRLAVSRRKANDPSRRVGALVINPSGPGGSGVDFSFRADRYFSAEIVDRFDVIGFDPRGVARSRPIECSAEVLARRPSSHPRNESEFDQLVAYNKELREDCRKQSGPIFDHASARDVADDIDAIRRALGERKISYYGGSYGTIMGQHYAERYGRNIRAMIIDSNMDHSIGAWQFMQTEARGAEDTFQEWVKWSDRTPSSPLHGQDLRGIWRDLLAKAARGEVKDGAGNIVTPVDLGDLVLALGQGPRWRTLADYVVLLGQGAPAAKPFAKAGTSPSPFAGIFCSDYDFRVGSWGEYRALAGMENRLAPDVPGSSVGHDAVMGCAGFPKATNPQRPLNIRYAPKILMTNAKHDPATVYDWAVNVHRQSRDTTVLVTYEGWGHGVYGRGECTLKVNNDYLMSLTLPRTGTTCAAVEPPETARGRGLDPDE